VTPPTSFPSTDRAALGPADISIAESLPADRLTEAGAAERFARLHGDDVRYDHRRSRWLHWQSHRWAPDADEEVKRLALLFARTWQRDALDIDEPERRKAALAAAVRLERRQALVSMLEFAAALKPIADAGDGWDRDPWLLGVPNGVVDLRTGMLRDGHPGDRITMQAGTPYDPTATCDRWTDFIAEIFAGCDELVTFVQRAIGYSLTGDTSEQVLFLGYGKGANGKGTLTQTLAHLLGDYAYAMPFSTVELHQRSAIPNDLAALFNRRFVSASETNDGTRLNESRVKALTGCDPITARFLHAEFFTFQPVAKYWLSVNHKPVVRDDSYAFWRRLRLIPFTQTFTIDKSLGPRLRDEAPGILAWCVRGCLAWQQCGLEPPTVVTEATAAYEAESDPLRDFVDAELEQQPESQIHASDLYDTYCQWAKEHGLTERERMTATMFGRKMGERFPFKRINGRKVYLDVARRTKS
jgi:putative DNA primase/helicase